jgi:chromosome segregation protein
MQIVQIEIDNFKSFAEKTVIPFRTGFTTISGPNGSGKSNIIDSMLFCLGLSSSRVMRAEKLTDLINNLTKRREAIVRIGFGQPQTPQDAAIPLFWIARRIKENPGGYTSTYYLNDKPATLTEVHEYLAQYHISPGTYNVMMQGDVAGIVNMSAMERRKIVDEMAGIAEFDRKIDQATTELTATAGNIERNTILLTELTERLAQLATERDVALKYQTLKDKRKHLEALLLAAETQEMADTVDRLKASLAELDAKEASLTQQITTLQAQLTQVQAELDAANLAIQRKGEDQYLAIRNQMEGLKGHIDRKQQTIKLMTTQLADNEQQRQTMHQETQRQQDRRTEINATCTSLISQIAEVAGLWKQEQAAYQTLQQQLDGLLSDSQQAERHRLRQVLEASNDALSNAKRDLLDAEAQQQRLQGDREAQEARYKDQQTQLTQLTDRLTELAAQLKATGLDEQAALTAVEKTQLALSEKRVKLKTVQLDYDECRQQLMQQTAQKRAYDDVHFGRSVDMILQAGLAGVHGTLAQLGTVPDAYSLAVEIALGGRMQHIVVDTDRDAQEGIELLKQRRGGRATFLPLNKLAPPRHLPSAPNRPGVVDFALNLLTFDAQYDTVFAFALGDTLIVESIEAARPLLKQYRMVTLDGSLMEKSGAMTGGSSPQRGGVRFANTQGLDSQIAELETRLQTLTQQRQTLEQAVQQLEASLADHQKAVTLTQQHRVKAQASHDALADQHTTLKHSLAPVAVGSSASLTPGNMDALRLHITQCEALTTQHTQALALLDAQFPADQLEQLRKDIADQAFQVEYYDTQKRNLETDLKAKELEVQHHDQALAHYAERLTVLVTKDATCQQEIADAQAEVTTTQVQLDELTVQIAGIDSEVKALQQQRQTIQTQVLELDKQKHGLERQKQQLGDQRLGYQARQRELAPQLQQLKAQLVLAYPNGLPEGPIPAKATVEQDLKATGASMARLEPVNMKAIQEYDEVYARHNDLHTRIDTLTQERDTLLVRIAGYEDLKQVAFRQTFEQVDNHFKTIFAELSDGIGQLVLTDPVNPLSSGLTIQAQPRGKKMQRLEAMSGGEKSLTSLAFVFALQRVKPAPFYALDEVDQNLDGMNAERLAQLVQREAQHSQFVVVSLRKPMLAASHRTIGVTQKRDGITKVTGVLLRTDDPTLPPAPADTSTQAAS